MHKHYGPIVRISPCEVHIDDPHFFDQMYNMTNKLDKESWYYNSLNRPYSTFATFNKNVYRLCCGALLKFFSLASISKIEPMMADRLKNLCRCIEEHHREKKPVALSFALRALTTDIVMEYAVPEAPTLLEHEDFATDFSRFVQDMSHSGNWNRHFPIIMPIFDNLPRFVVANLSPGPGLAAFEILQQQKKLAAIIVKNNGKSLSSKDYPVTMNQVFNSNLPKEGKIETRLFQEIAIVIGAGMETTANAAVRTIYHLLSSPPRLAKLKEELSQVSHQHPDEIIRHQEFETLPYLGACIKEGLRLSTGVSGRLPRVDRTQSTRYKDHMLSAGISISMSLRDLHYHSDVFSEPTAFNPERCLDLDDDKRRDLEKYFVQFGRGSRSCVGQNFAMAELYAALGNIFSRFEMELYETRLEDVAMAHDSFAPFPPRESAGLQVRVV